MLVGGGGFCVGVSKATLKAASAAVGDDVEMTLEAAPDPGLLLSNPTGPFVV